MSPAPSPLLRTVEPEAPSSRTLRAPDLVPAGLAPPERSADIARVGERYAVAVTPAMARLIDPADPNDPIARQFVPDIRELDDAPGERADPIGDGAHSPVEGLVHRYPDRVLLKLVHVCAVYCRFCFRREMVGPGAGTMLSPAQLEAALAYVRACPAIGEVVVTGGDPLVLAPRRIAEVNALLKAIPHVAVVRWHTRVPVVAPERIDGAMVAALRGGDGAATWIAIHANHAREFTPAACAALARLADAGIPLVSQTVLLRGVNDDVEVLAALMRAFVANRVKPYYLHHGDLAPGTAHWRTTIAEGRALVKALRGRLSGLCQPTYVLDIPGGFGKAPIGPDALAADGAAIEDWRGNLHSYPPEESA